MIYAKAVLKFAKLNTQSQQHEAVVQVRTGYVIIKISALILTVCVLCVLKEKR
ncbi:MAG: hypothetical protein LBK06_08130 [Planctomycetaceae bacterium]|nr:hypothetical protein [Planctomycetaceae bacterium]